MGMEPSAGVEAAVRGLFGILQTNDAGAMEAVMTPDDPVIGIGTDPMEWWSGYETLLRVFRAQAEEMAGVQVAVGEVHAFEAGDFGWAAARPTLSFPDGNTVPSRFTAVAELTDGAWKLRHFHLSVGVANEEVVGSTLTV